MASFLPYKIPYQNQLQFNLGVPITTENMGVQFQQPRPILVERISGQHGIPGKVSAQHSEPTRESGVNYSILSEDKMSMMSHLARRDIHNGYLQAKRAAESQRADEAQSQARNPQTFASSRHQGQSRINDARLKNKPNNQLTVRDTGKNRVFGAVQTPPPRKPTMYYKRDDSVLSARNESVNTTGGSDVYFPVKTVPPEAGPVVKDEMIKLQMEITGCLHLLEAVLSRAISEHSLAFLLPPVNCKQKEGFLSVEEDIHRAQTRAEEHKIRCIRTVYNLTQKVKKLKKDIPTTDLTNAIRKAQIMSQLAAILRGASKAIQVFVSHLPFQRLESGLPPHYCDLAVLLRQVGGLISLTQDGGLPEDHRSLESLLNSIDNLNVKWCSHLNQTSGLARSKKSGISHDWISDTKVAKDIFATKNKPVFTTYPKKASDQPKKKAHQTSQPKPQLRKPGKGPLGKENRSALASRTKQQGFSVGTVHQKQRSSTAPYRGPNIGEQSNWNPAMNKEQVQDALSEQRRAWIEMAAAKFDKASSDPSSPSKRKGVNFDLTDHPTTSPLHLRSTNSSPSNFTESPFYVAQVPDGDVREMFPDKQTARSKIGTSSNCGFRPLPENGRLRSADVSNSFIDAVEHRLLSRLLEQNGVSRTYEGNSKNMESQKILLEVDERTSSVDVGDWSDHLVEKEIQAEAVSLVDAPTLENIQLRLSEMQREQREISERWSSLKFADVQQRSKRLTSSEHAPRNPPAIQVTRMTALDRKHSSIGPERTAWTEEPLIFTRQDGSHQARQINTHIVEKQKVVASKKMLTFSQTAVEKIQLERQRYESYLRKRSHHPSGHFDPWKLVEEISDEILDDCLQEVARELESVNEAIANDMFKSEFMVDKAAADVSLTSRGGDIPPGTLTREEEGLVSPHQQGWGGGDAPGVNFDPMASPESQKQNRFHEMAQFSPHQMNTFKYSGESVQLLPDDLSDKVVVINTAAKAMVNNAGVKRVKDTSVHSSDNSESEHISPESSLSELTPNKPGTPEKERSEEEERSEQKKRSEEEERSEQKERSEEEERSEQKERSEEEERSEQEEERSDEEEHRENGINSGAVEDDEEYSDEDFEDDNDDGDDHDGDGDDHDGDGDDDDI